MTKTTHHPNLRTRALRATVAAILLAAATACNNNQPIVPSDLKQQTAAKAPAGAKREESAQGGTALRDMGSWNIQQPQISPMDGARSQLLSTYGRYPSVKLVLSFDNGKLSSGRYAGVFITSPCWVDGWENAYSAATRYKRRVRVRFDDDAQPRVEFWNITADHHGIFPPSQLAFVSALKRHRSLMVEFGCDRSDPGDVFTFSISRLQEAMDAAGLANEAVSKHEQWR